jgi:hypothetical protein
MSYIYFNTLIDYLICRAISITQAERSKKYIIYIMLTHIHSQIHTYITKSHTYTYKHSNMLTYIQIHIHTHSHVMPDAHTIHKPPSTSTFNHSYIQRITHAEMSKPHIYKHAIFKLAYIYAYIHATYSNIHKRTSTSTYKHSYIYIHIT